MSADNWAYCPKCKAIKTAEKAASIQAAKEAYGKVSADEYERLVSASRAEPQFEESLREDYDLGVTKSGIFYINYGCSCSVCGFEHSHKSEQALDLS